MFSGGLSSTLLPGEDIETCASGATQATPFPENEYSRKRIAFRPRSDKIDGPNGESQGFWLQIVYEQDGYDRPDSFDMSELVNLNSIFLGVQESSSTTDNPSPQLITKKLSQVPPNLLPRSSEVDDKSRTEEIRQIRSETVFNIGTSTKVGSEYIVKILNS